MRRFRFTSAEIDRCTSNRAEWHNFVRRREAEIAFALFPNRRFRLGLELGAGDGGQSVAISEHCDKLICTEIDENSHSWLGQSILSRRVSNVDYAICDAQDLSRFADGTFDRIFSSNMLEHIPDVGRCLEECRRVLSSDGLMLHTMPSRWWKVFSSGLSMVKLRAPRVHGVSRSHYREFVAFGASVWCERIQSHGLQVIETVGLPFYVGHGNSFVSLVKAGNALGLSGSYLYVVQKQL